MKEALEGIVVEELDTLGFDLVELRFGGSKSRQVFDVRIDRRDGVPVSVDDCARASRAIEARLDTEQKIAGDRYVLEVSSPGIDRKLTRTTDWERFKGRKANVKSAALGGRVEVEILGIDQTESGAIVKVRDAAGAEHAIPLADVIEARLAVHW